MAGASEDSVVHLANDTRTQTLTNKTTELPPTNTCTVAVIGLGYVGLPLAVEFARSQLCQRSGVQLKRQVIGFDVNQQRVRELIAGKDITNETTEDELIDANNLEYTFDEERLASADVFIVTVPTPIDRTKRPDLTALKNASMTVGRSIKTRSCLEVASLPVIIYESTVYPGATEEICVPLIEKESGLEFNKDFFCGYSPERINPGDRTHRLPNIVKITSGSTIDSSKWVDNFYGSIIKAGTHEAGSIKIAEAAKVIENTQRDLNIALVNELAMICRKIGIDTLDVLEAAGTKWNFLPFKPGLVGGHCIGVDPYYLTHKAEQLGYYPQVVLAGRRINDSMGRWVAEQTVIELAQRGTVIAGSKVLIMGFTFKENCPDYRNTRVVDLISALELYRIKADIVDPLLDSKSAVEHLNYEIYRTIPESSKYEAIVIAVAHDEFKLITKEVLLRHLSTNGFIVDIKGIIPRDLNPLRI